MNLKVSEILAKTQVAEQQTIKSSYLSFDDEGGAYFKQVKDIDWCHRKYLSLSNRRHASKKTSKS